MKPSPVDISWIRSVSLTIGVIHWPELVKLSEDFLRAHQETLGGRNVLVVKMMECLLDAYTGDVLLYTVYIAYAKLMFCRTGEMEGWA